jgi:hypothetical protein
MTEIGREASCWGLSFCGRIEGLLKMSKRFVFLDILDCLAHSVYPMDY